MGIGTSFGGPKDILYRGKYSVVLFQCEEVYEGERWAILVGCAGLAAVVIPLYPAAKDMIKDA